MKKTILITGGAGFIGSNLSKKLLDLGHKVVCVDNLVTGSLKNINQLLSRVDFNFQNLDISSDIKFNKFGKIDEVYHLASPADPNNNSRYSYIQLPFETMLVNSQGTWNMCDFALKNRAKLSFSSTSEIYGDPLVSPQDEQYRGNVSTTGPRSVYDESKRFGETIVSAFIREKNLDARITRIFNTYGPNMNPLEGRSVVNFINQALRGEDITVYGDGKQTRSFCFIDDQVEGQILAMESKNTNGEVFNLGNDDERSILEFAKKIKQLTGTKSKIVIGGKLPVDDPMQRKPDLTKAKKVLGWKPKVGLEEGLMATIKYFQKTIQ